MAEFELDCLIVGCRDKGVRKLKVQLGEKQDSTLSHSLRYSFSLRWSKATNGIAL
jgi:hypothetical protein